MSEFSTQEAFGAWRWKDIWCKAGLYLRRLYLAWSPWCHASVHWLYSPDSADQHDHPASFFSIILRGGYVEEVATYSPTGVRWDVRTRRVRWFNFKRAEGAHAIREIEPGTVTLVLWGRRRRPWGFWVRAEGYTLGFTWVPWQEYEER